MTNPPGGGGSEEALFRAVADFNQLIRQANQAAAALGGMADQGRRIGPDVNGGLGQGQRGVQSFGQRLGTLSSQLDRTGKDFTLKVGVPSLLVARAGISAFEDFETSIVMAGQKAGATGKELDQMKKLALDMGAKTKFSAGESAGALDMLAASGMNAEQAMKALPGVMLAAQASNESLGLTAQAVSQAINAFALSSDDAGHVADVFTTAANTTALSMQGIADGIANAGEVGSRFGTSLEGMIAWLGRLVDQGVPAADAATAIRQAMVSMSSPQSLRAKNVIRDLGIQVRGLNGKLLQPPELLHALSVALDVNNPKLKAAAKEAGKGADAYHDYALQQLFGVQGAKAVGLAIGQGKPLILDAQKNTKELTALQGELAKTMGDKGAKAWIAARTEAGKFTATGADTVRVTTALEKSLNGVAQAASDKLGTTTKQKIDNLKGSIETLLITGIGKNKGLLDGLVVSASKFVGWLQKMSNEHPGLMKLVGAIVAIGIALGPVLILAGKLVGGFRTVASVFSKTRGPGKFAPGLGGRGGIQGPIEVFALRPIPVEIVGSLAPGGLPGSRMPGGAPVPIGPGGAPVPPGKVPLRQRLNGMGGFLLGSAAMIGGSALDDGGTGGRHAAGQTLNYAGMGAMVGSVIPGIGTLGGAAIGGGLGLAKSFADWVDGGSYKKMQDLANSLGTVLSAEKDIKGAIVESGNALSSQTIAVIRSKIEKTDMMKSAAKAGLTEKDLANAVSGSATMYARVVKAWKDGANPSAAQLQMLKELRDRYSEATISARKYADEHGIVMKGDLKTMTATQLLSKAQYNLNTAQLTGAQANSKYHGTLTQLTAAVVQNGTSLDQGTKFGRDNAAAIRKAASAALLHAQAVYQQTGSVQKSLDVLKQDRQRLIDAAVAAGLNKDEVVKLANAIYGIPANKHSKVTVNTAQAAYNVSYLKHQMDALRDKRINIDTYLRTVILPDVNDPAHTRQPSPVRTRGDKDGGEIPHLAGGGEVRGRGGPRSDKVPYLSMLSNREFVVNALDYQRNKDAVQAINAGRPDLALAALSRSVGARTLAAMRLKPIASSTTSKLDASGEARAKTTVFAPTINNPKHETSEESLTRTYSKMAYLGFGRFDD
jgi:TP901 family phage tail tape measure protein